jgi:hypothetical protein
LTSLTHSNGPPYGTSLRWTQQKSQSGNTQKLGQTRTQSPCGCVPASQQKKASNGHLLAERITPAKIGLVPTLMLTPPNFNTPKHSDCLLRKPARGLTATSSAPTSKRSSIKATHLLLRANTLTTAAPLTISLTRKVTLSSSVVHGNESLTSSTLTLPSPLP